MRPDIYPDLNITDKNFYIRWCWIPPGLSVIKRSGNISKLVFLSRGFWISQRPIMIGDYQKLCDLKCHGNNILNREHTNKKDNTPLTSITHGDAQMLCEKFFNGRLPTEEEWEKAVMWVDGSYPHLEQIKYSNEEWQYPPPVGGDDPNPWGLQNGTGCVWQWTNTKLENTEIYICKGAWWGAPLFEKLDASIRLIPTEPAHIRTGFRVVIDVHDNF